MRKKHEYDDNQLDEADLIIGGEINKKENYKVGNQNVVMPVYQKRIDYFEYNFLKTYAYAIFSRMLVDPEISIINLNTPVSSINQALMPPRLVSQNEDIFPFVANDTLHLNLMFKNSNYQVTISCMNSSDGLLHFLSVSGNEARANAAALLATYFMKQSMKNSSFKGKILGMKWDMDGHLDIQEQKREEFKNEKFENIFIPHITKRELIRFSECVEHFDKIGISLRFLLSGAPGTAKTKCIRAVINKCHGVTTLIPEGHVNFPALFKFANLFPKSLICLDDLDLYFGNRELSYSPNNLSDFLGYMDGLIKNSIFLLASTNDKELIDLAARRPGRFDMLLDFSYISKDNYTELIRANTKDEEILSVFDSEIFRIFEKRKSPGSFIVSIIKQLKTMKALHPECNLKEYAQEYIQFSFDGFYKNNPNKQDDFGFTSG